MSELLVPASNDFLRAHNEEMIVCSRQNATIAYSAGDLTTAEQILRSALAVVGVDAGVLSDLSVVVYNSGRHDEGVAINKWALRVEPSHPDAVANHQAMQAATQNANASNVDPFVELAEPVRNFAQQLLNLKSSIASTEWYPYSSMTNFGCLNELLTRERRDLRALIANRPVADIACADGDIGLLFDRLGYEVDLVDQAASNMNGLRGAHQLKAALGANVSIHDMDIDCGMQLPRSNYGLVFFLGILYHLKNPFLAMETLSRVTDWCLVSTRVAQTDPAHETSFDHLPMAYLVAPRECNNDSSNYWMFTNTGLKRLFDRCGWDVHDYVNLGHTIAADPASNDHDGRAFVLLRSRHAPGS